MVHYIRFLKPPTSVAPNSAAGFTIKAVVALTTDLGEEFYHHDVSLKATLLSSVGDEFSPMSSQSLVWRNGSRALPVSIRVGKAQSRMRFKMHVSVLSGEDVGLLDIHTIPKVFEIWSDEFEATKPPAYPRTVTRSLKLAPDNNLTIQEEAGESIARHVWDAGIGLVALMCCWLGPPGRVKSVDSSWLQRMSAPEQSKVRAVELGSGCGLVGIALAQMRQNTSVLLTDLPEAMSVLESNLSRARCAGGASLEKCVLDWEQPLPEAARETLDLIIISDCTYNQDSSPALVRTVSAMIEDSPEAVVLVSMKMRHASEYVFFELMERAGFEKSQHDTVVLPDDSRELTAQDLEQIEVYAFRRHSCCM